MAEKVTKRRLTILITLFLAVILVWWPELNFTRFGTSLCDPELLCVVFLDVGQGDAIFIRSPSGVQMVIDGGRDSSVLRELGAVMAFSDRDLDYLLATHPDADHVSGLVPILDRYEVANMIRTENESGTGIWRAFEERVETEEATVHIARRGQIYDLGSGVTLQILFPDMDPTELESNTSSIVALLRYEESTFMLTGDAPKSIEEYLVLIEGEHLKSDVLKAGHHGSRTSTSELFLSHVEPTYAVISASADNSYGHPHVEVTDLLFNYGVEVFSTAEQGMVVFHSDGESILVK